MMTLLNVEGMSCENCSRHVKTALEALPGVQAVTVDLAGHKAQVTHGDVTTVDALIAAVAEEGYRADVIV